MSRYNFQPVTCTDLSVEVSEFLYTCTPVESSLYSRYEKARQKLLGSPLINPLFSSFQTPKTPLQKSMDKLGKQLTLFSFGIIGEWSVCAGSRGQRGAVLSSHGCFSNIVLLTWVGTEGWDWRL